MHSVVGGTFERNLNQESPVTDLVDFLYLSEKNYRRDNLTRPNSSKHLHASEKSHPLDKTIKSTTTVILRSEAYFKIILHAFRHANPQSSRSNWIEVLGLLTGRLMDPDSLDQTIYVDQAWPIGHGDAVSVRVQDYGTTLTRILDEKAKESVICGWYHSHPGYGLFMSSNDFETQLYYQRMWNQAIALVVDPTLISSKNLGYKIFRLIKPEFTVFETLPTAIADRFSKKSIPFLSPHLSNLAMKGGKLEEYDIQIPIRKP